MDGYSSEDIKLLEEGDKFGALSPNQKNILNEYRNAQANARQRGASEFSQLSRGGMPLGPGAIPDTNAPIPEDNSFQQAGDTFKKELKGYLGGAQIPYLSPAAIGVAGTITDDVINQYDRVRSGQYNAESPLVRLSRMADSLKTNYKMADNTIKDWKNEGELGATLGRIPRDVLLFELGSAALGGAGAGASAAGNSSKWAKLGNFGKDVGRTTLIGTGIDQLENPDFNRIGSDIKTNAGMDLFLRGLATGGRKTGEGIYNFFKSPERNQKLIESTVPIYGSYKRGIREDAIKNADDLYKSGEVARKAKYDSGVHELMSQYEEQEAKRQIAHQLEKRDAVESFKGLINNDGTSAAENLKKILDDRSLALSRQYDEAVTPVMQRYAGIEINPQNTVSKIDELLKQYQLVNDAGKPSVKALNTLFDPEIKSMGKSLLKAKKKLGKHRIKTQGEIVYAGTRGEPATKIVPYGESSPEVPNNLFGGIFGSFNEDVARSHGDKIQKFITTNHIDHDDIFSEVFYDGYYEVYAKHLKELFKKRRRRLSPDEVDELLEYIMERKNIFSDEPDMGRKRFEHILRLSDNGEISWDFQGLKGELARRQGYTSVGMLDEHGESVLMLSLPKIKYKNPTIQDLDLANRQFGDIANFGKPVKSSKEKIFGNLYHQGRSDLTDALEKAASPEELQTLLGAKQNYASNKGLLDEMLKTFNKPSDRLAVNLRSKIPGSKISELVEKIPESKDSLSDLFLNMLTQSSTSPRKFTKEIDYYGRDVLKNLLGNKKFKQLVDAEKRLHTSNIPFKKSVRPTPIPYKEAPRPDIPELKPSLPARGLAKIGSAFDPAKRKIQNREFTYMLNSPIKKLIEMNDPEAEARKLYGQMKRGKKMSNYEVQKLLDFLENSQ